MHMPEFKFIFIVIPLFGRNTALIFFIRNIQKIKGISDIVLIDRHFPNAGCNPCDTGPYS